MQSLGMSCTTEAPCPLYLELTAAESMASRLLIAGNLHTNAVTLSSVVLVSEDGGATWSEAHPPIRQGTLDQIQFFDFANGWISGQVLAALPRDPFFLITADGGKSWKRRPVFSDATFGFVEKFHFSSATRGLVQVDRSNSAEGGRYAILESQTSGDTWAIREVTDTPPARYRFDFSPNPSIRLRADAATKSWRVERLSAGKWAAVSAFLVHAGDCKPLETELKEPEQPVTPESDAVEVFRVGGPPTSKKKAPPKKKP